VRALPAIHPSTTLAPLWLIVQQGDARRQAGLFEGPLHGLADAGVGGLL